MYQTIYELPSQVRSSLDEADQEVFLKAYNDESPSTSEEVKKALRKAWRACKDLPSSFSFRIVAAADDIDRDMEIIDVDSVKKHLDSFIDYGGNINWEHSNYTVAHAWDWEPTKINGVDGVIIWGNVFGGDEVYDNMRKAFTEGRNSLSIAGEAERGKYQCDDKGCYTRRGVKQLMEISLCSVPANRHCNIQWYNDKARLTKSANTIHFNVEEYTLHKDRDNCPIHAVKRILIGMGFDAHATPEGAVVNMSRDMFSKVAPDIRAKGLYPFYDTPRHRFIAMEREPAIEYAFRKGYELEAVDINGDLTRKIRKSTFSQFYDAGVLVCDNGRYRLEYPREDP